MTKKYVKALGLASALLLSSHSHATIVLFKTSQGDFEVNLFDQTTPQTVQNFLSYVKAGSYNKTLFHRSLNGFIVQGGGYTFSGNSNAPLSPIASQAAVKNEPKWSNVRGTIAMAKVANQPNSATNQWFFNLSDNSAGSAQLDLQNSGFTVFGQVSGNGMEILSAIAALPVRNIGGFEAIPLRNYSAQDVAAATPVTAANMVTIESITVVNADPATAASLSPKANTAITNAGNTGSSSSSGGAAGLWSLLGLALLGWRRQRG